MLHLRLEQADLGELGELVEQTEAVPSLGLVHQDDHAATRLEAVEGYRKLGSLQAMSLTMLAIGRDLVGTKDTALTGDKVESLTRSDGSLEEALGVRVVRGYLVQGEAEVNCQHRDVCLNQIQSRALHKTLHALFLDGKGNADHLDIRVDLQCLANEAARRKAEREHARSLARETEDAGGLLHLASNAVHHSEEDLGRFRVGIIAELSLALKVPVTLRIIPALR